MPKIIPFNLSTWQNNIKENVFDADSSIWKNRIKIINKEKFFFIYNEYESCVSEHDKKYAEDVCFVPIDSTAQGVELYFCGKLHLQPSVDSYLILRKQYFERLGYSYFLILFNVKSNKLYSIVKISRKEPVVEVNDFHSKSYIMHKNEFLEIDDSFGFPYLTDYLETELNIDSNKAKTFHYFRYKLGNDGYVYLLD